MFQRSRRAVQAADRLAAIVQGAQEAEAPVVDDRHAVGDLLGHAQQVCVDMKMVMPAGACLQQVLDQPGAARIEADHRLVDDQHGRIVQQGRGEGQPLPHAVRIGFGQLVDEIVQLEIGDVAADRRIDLRRGRARTCRR